jgi:hypothetical protein
MNIPQAMTTAKQWNRGRRGALGKLLRANMIVDDVHRVRLVVEVLYEMDWLERRLKDHNPYQDGRTTYTLKDLTALKNLLEVVRDIPCGETI